jgi:hypothetical protein
VKLYLLSQTENRGYDTFDSVVVAAENENDARMTYPGYHSDGKIWDGLEKSMFGTWCDACYVDVDYLGKARKGMEAGIVVASFNAG